MSGEDNLVTEGNLSHGGVRYGRRAHCRAVTAFEAVVVVAIILGCVGSAAVYHRQVLKRGKELVLKAELQNLRASIAFFEATKGRRPQNLEEVLAQPLGHLRVVGSQRQWVSVRGGSQSPVDPFGHPYRYDAKAGTAASQSAGYETW